MKVLLLTTHLNMGGIAVYTVSLAKYLKKQGIEVAVASSGGELEEVLAKNDIQHIEIDIMTKFEFGIKVWKGILSLRRIVKENGFQLIHAQTRVAQVLACMVSSLIGVPFVSTCHGFYNHRRLSRRLFPCWGNKVIAISKSVQKHLIGDFRLRKKSVKQIYNGIELERYLIADKAKDKSLMRSIGLDEDAMIIGGVGRLSPIKGFRYLISAFKNAARDCPKLQLLIVGEGPEKDFLERHIHNLSLKDKVFLVPGGVPLEKYLFSMDIFCLPSIDEGLGMSLMEAMAAGLACIGSNTGGIQELIAHETDGMLVPPQDENALTNAILRLVKDEGFRKKLADNAHRKAVAEFSIENSVKETIEVYREVGTSAHI